MNKNKILSTLEKLVESAWVLDFFLFLPPIWRRIVQVSSFVICPGTLWIFSYHIRELFFFDSWPPLDLICSWTEPIFAKPSLAISPDPTWVKCTKFIGSPIMLRSIRLLLFFGGAFSTIQQFSLCQKSLMVIVAFQDLTLYKWVAKTPVIHSSYGYQIVPKKRSLVSSVSLHVYNPLVQKWNWNLKETDFRLTGPSSGFIADLYYLCLPLISPSLHM